MEIVKKEIEAERIKSVIDYKMAMLTSLEARVLELYYLKGYSRNKVANIIGYSEV